MGTISELVDRSQRRYRWLHAEPAGGPHHAQGERLPDAGALLDALLTADKWMVRRKDVVRFATERELRRSHSFDFFVPDCVVRPFNPAPLVPLGFWWKAPDRYFEIDFIDEEGRSLPLHRTAYSKRLTRNILLEHARRVLGYESSEDLLLSTYASIFLIVEAEQERAANEFNVGWNERIHNAEIMRLTQEPEFMLLLETAAFASVVTTKVRGDLSQRHLVKLRYTERQESYFGTDRYKHYGVGGRRRLSSLRRWALRVLGLGAFELSLSNPFVRAQSYHFEAYSPPGLQFAGASMRILGRKSKAETSRLEHNLHLEEKEMGKTSRVTVRSKLLVTDGWLTSAIICTSIAVGVLFGIEKNVESFEPSASQNVIAAMLLLPSVAISIVWRRVHWVVERLHKWIRYAFLSVSVLLFYLAFRIAESKSVTTSEMSMHLPGPPLIEFEQSSRFLGGESLAVTAKVIMIYTALVLVVLLVARFHRDRLREIWYGIRGWKS